MALAQHIHRRGGIYHLRLRVPSDLIHTIRRGEIHRSLGTSHPKEAKWRGNHLYGLILGIFDGLRLMADSKEEWLAQLSEMSDSKREKTICDLFDLATASVHELGREQGRRQQAEADVHKLTGAVKTLVQSMANSVSPDSLEVLERCKVAMVDLQQKNKKLESSAAVGEGVAVVTELAKLLGVPHPGADTPTVSAFLTGSYLEEKSLQDDTNRHVQNYITLFARITGDKRLADYTRSDVVKYMRTLERLSNSTGKSPEDKEATIERLLEKSDGKPTMSKTTINKHVQHVKGFFDSARVHFKFTTKDSLDEMFRRITPSDFVPSPQRRKSWPIDKLNALFSTPIWQGTNSAAPDFTKRHLEGDYIYRDAYWWLPIAAPQRSACVAQARFKCVRHGAHQVEIQLGPLFR